MQKSSINPWYLNLWMIGALFLIIALFIYKPALNGGFVWDDQAHVTKPELQSFSGLIQIWTNPSATQQYYPLLHTAFWVEHKLWADNPLPYHLLNIGLHILAALLFIKLLSYYTIPGPSLAGLLFLIHPVCVESVAWVSEQKNTLSLVFYLFTWLVYIKYYESKRPLLYYLSLLFFICALLTKSVTATLPAALLVLFWYKEGDLKFRTHIKPLLPWFIIALISGLFTAWVERHMIGAEGSEFSLSFVERIFLCCRIICFYLTQLVWPTNLSFFYPHWNVHVLYQSWIQYVILVTAITIVLWLYRFKSRALFSGWLYFCGSLFPALGFFNVYPFRFSYVADHFQYLPSLAIYALCAAAAVLGFNALAKYSRLGVILVFAACLTLATLAFNQAGTYRDVKTLYTSTLDKNPDAWIAHYNLGILLAHDGQFTDAITHFSEAVSLKADYTEALVNWGDALGQMGKPTEAILLYQKALTEDPNQIEANTNLGLYLSKVGKPAAAIEQLRRALRINNNYAPAHYNLANILRSTGSQNEAVEHYIKAIQLDPDYADASLNLGNVFLGQNETQKAIKQYRNALRIKPYAADVHNSLGVALTRVGSYDEAISHYKKAIELNPGYATAHANLARALLKMGRNTEAEAEWNTAQTMSTRQ